MSDRISPGQLSELLDIPPSSLRRYVKRFGDYLSDDANKTRGRSFNESDIAVIARIRDLAQHGEKLNDIPEKLESIPEEISDEDINELQLTVVNKKIDNLIDTVLMLDARLSKLEQPLWKRILNRD